MFLLMRTWNNETIRRVVRQQIVPSTVSGYTHEAAEEEMSRLLNDSFVEVQDILSRNMDALNAIVDVRSLLPGGLLQPDIHGRTVSLTNLEVILYRGLCISASSGAVALHVRYTTRFILFLWSS